MVEQQPEKETSTATNTQVSLKDSDSKGRREKEKERNSRSLAYSVVFYGSSSSRTSLIFPVSDCIGSSTATGVSFTRIKTTGTLNVIERNCSCTALQ